MYYTLLFDVPYFALHLYIGYLHRSVIHSVGRLSFLEDKTGFHLFTEINLCWTGLD